MTKKNEGGAMFENWALGIGHSLVIDHWALVIAPPYRTPLIFRARPCRYTPCMSIYRRMLGRELPLTLRQLLAIEPKLLPGKKQEAFERRIEFLTGDVQVLHRLGLSSIAAEHW